MIALERLGKPIPQKLFKSITDYVSARPGRNYPSTDGLMLAALSHVVSTASVSYTHLTLPTSDLV